jgi:4-alpha-glucanotransferase
LNRLLEDKSQWKVSLTLENGATKTQSFSGEALKISSDAFGGDTVLAHLPCKLAAESGYHSMQVEASAQRQALELQTTVISAPVRCYSPSRSRKSWGVFIPLYALRSRGDWGTGDFASLNQLHQWARSLGASWMGTLPLLSTFLDHPCEPSPYMPVSRLHWNELYIAPELEPEFAESSAVRRIAATSHWRDALRRIRQTPLVEYREAMLLKRRVLEAMAEEIHRRQSPRTKAFLQYVASNPDLNRYARFRAVHEQRGTKWTQWPTRMKDGTLTSPDSDAKRERYHRYVQWIAELQLARISNQEPTRGLYLDFPLGVHPQGYDVWRNQRLFALSATAGAPPDDLFPGGQNWGFPPLHPEAIRKHGYRYFRDCLRHQMRHAKLLRIDHVMGLNRLYWIPEGIATRDGVYVEYRSEEMYAVLSLESHRAGTTIVGENLGTVPPAVTHAMKRHRALGMYVLQFSLSPSVKKPIVAPARERVASVNTHDTPTFAAFLRGGDISDFQRLGVFTPESAARKREDRKRVVAALAKTFGIKDVRGSSAQRQLLSRCLRWMAESPANIAMVNLEDTWLEQRPQNIPGTGAGTKNPDQPNWRRKARYTLEQILSDTSIRRRLMEAFGSRNASSKRHV